MQHLYQKKIKRHLYSIRNCSGHNENQWSDSAVQTGFFTCHKNPQHKPKIHSSLLKVPQTQFSPWNAHIQCKLYLIWQLFLLISLSSDLVHPSAANSVILVFCPLYSWSTLTSPARDKTFASPFWKSMSRNQPNILQVREDMKKNSHPLSLWLKILVSSGPHSFVMASLGLS